MEGESNDDTNLGVRLICLPDGFGPGVHKPHKGFDTSEISVPTDVNTTRSTFPDIRPSLDDDPIRTCCKLEELCTPYIVGLVRLVILSVSGYRLSVVGRARQVGNYIMKRWR